MFAALKQARLIAPGTTWQELRYSRGGRTDKGVSGEGEQAGGAMRLAAVSL